MDSISDPILLPNFEMLALIPLVFPIAIGSYLLAQKHKQGTFKTIQFYLSIPLFGKWLLSWIITLVTPYSGTIPFRINLLTLNESEVEMTTRFWMLNPFKSCHVAALLNFGEITQGLLVICNTEAMKKRAIPTKITIECFIKV